MLLNVTVFGLGHIGLITGLYIANNGHKVNGVEIISSKVELLKSKKFYISEKNLPEIFHKTFEKNFFVSTQVEELDEIIFVCVGTPPLMDGSVDLHQIEETTLCIAKLLEKSKKIHQIVYRSTFPPGTIENLVIPTLAKHSSSKKLNSDYFIYYFPEFLREGSAWEDICDPSLNVWGSDNKKQIPAFHEELGFNKIEVSVVSYKSGEMIKYLNNSFHALKITFANEMASMAASLHVDINEVFDIFLKDNKLNISEKYLRPGFAFGGPCLPKELKGISMMAKQKSIELPVSNAILESNEDQIKRFITYIEKSSYQTIGISGISFKPATSDLRNSPLLDVIRYFSRQRTYQQKKKFIIYDTNIIKSDFDSLNLVGTTLVDNVNEMLGSLDVLILGPYQLNADEVVSVINKVENIIDLLYFKSNSKFKSIKNYKTLFEIEI